ncbi:MAG: hypothetical protein PHN75_09380, partial [Syntrophales bacterium]|nr:hypothetical protein [Syntrophales bacterium]
SDVSVTFREILREWGQFVREWKEKMEKMIDLLRSPSHESKEDANLPKCIGLVTEVNNWRKGHDQTANIRKLANELVASNCAKNESRPHPDYLPALENLVARRTGCTLDVARKAISDAADERQATFGGD